MPLNIGPQKHLLNKIISEIALGQKYELASVSNLLNYWMLFKVILDHF